jgi:hypothetical protein
MLMELGKSISQMLQHVPESQLSTTYKKLLNTGIQKVIIRLRHKGKPGITTPKTYNWCVRITIARKEVPIMSFWLDRNSKVLVNRLCTMFNADKAIILAIRRGQ